MAMWLSQSGTMSCGGRFCEHVDLPELIDDERFHTNALRTENHESLFPILAEVMRRRTTDMWAEALEAIGVPCGPVNTVDKVANDPQVLARDMIAEVEHDITGAVQIPGDPDQTLRNARSDRCPRSKSWRAYSGNFGRLVGVRRGGN